jgi:AcrR family transcriptional regulator
MSVLETGDRITNAALNILLVRGVRNMSLTDVAYEAAVTRVTVHRYCRDKKGLIRLALRRIAGMFEKAAGDEKADSIEVIDGRLHVLGVELARLPKEPLLARLDEVKRLYPDVYEEFRNAEREAINRIFDQVLAVVTQKETLRAGINLEVLKTIFWASTIGLLEVPSLISSNVSLAEIFTTVSEVFRHGILKETPKEGDYDGA